MPDLAAITVVGAGRIGLSVVVNLVASGHAVEVVDTDEGRRAAVTAAGASWAGPVLGTLPVEQILVTVLPGGAELAAVMLEAERDSDGERLRHLQHGGTWIDLTSAAPDVSARSAAAAAERGVRLIDAAIGGGAIEAREGRLTLYVGGAGEDVDLVRPVLAAFADDIRYVGGHGAGHLTKLLINQAWFAQAAVLAEVVLLATRAGLDAEDLLGAFAGTPADSRFVRDYLPGALGGDRAAGFELSRIVEELDGLERAAAAARTPWTVGSRVAGLHREALAGMGDRDEELSVVAWLERLAGRRLADPPG